MKHSPILKEKFAILGLLWREGPLKEAEFTSIINSQEGTLRLRASKILLKEKFIKTFNGNVDLEPIGALKYERIGTALYGPRFLLSSCKSIRKGNYTYVYGSDKEKIVEISREINSAIDKTELEFKRTIWKINKFKSIAGYRVRIPIPKQ